MDWSGSVSCFSYLTRMFDRFLQIIDKCSSEKFERKTVDETVEIYFGKGASEAEKYLISTKKWPSEQAVELVRRIEKETDYVNRQAWLINGIFSFLVIGLLILSIVSGFYIGAIILGAPAIACIMALRKSVVRYFRSKYNPYIPNTPVRQS